MPGFLWTTGFLLLAFLLQGIRVRVRVRVRAVSLVVPFCALTYILTHLNLLTDQLTR
mgnify:CR=1 FL=1|jgi:hypothetical protein